MMAGILSVWWVWVAAALVLGIIEILLPGFIFLGFAIGALAMAAIVAFTLLPLTPALTIALFAGLSLIAWILLRQTFQAPRGSVKRFTDDINDH